MTQNTREWNFKDQAGQRSAHMLICVLLWIAACAAGLADPIDVKVDCSQSLCAFTYTPPDTNACTLAVTDNSGLVPSVNDVNPTLFPGANSDLSRTFPNGFRWPTLVNPSGSRTVFIGGNGGSRKASDTKWYTYSLQAVTQHTLTLTCAGGSSATVPFTTQNVPLGNYYPEPPPVDANAPFQAQLPTIDWTNRSTSYILDHGILVRRVSGPLDFPIGVSSVTNHAHAFDLNNAWTLPSNPPDTTHLASTSTPNAPLFLAFPFVNSYVIQNMYGSTLGYFTDILQHLYGNGSGTVSACISTDSGQSCASGSLLQPLSASSNTYNLPGSYPTAMFSGWGTASKPLGNWDLANVPFANVSVAGKTVTLPSGGRLNIDRLSGSKFQLTGCASGIGNGYYTVASVDSYTQLTAQETIGTASSCTYNDLGAGFRVVLTGAGTANISSTFESMGSIAMGSGTNGSRDLFSFNPLNITTDCDGHTRNPPISGYLGQMGQFGTNRVPIFMLQDDGRMCLQSVTYRPAGYLYGIENPFDSVNPLKWAMSTGDGHLMLATLTSCCAEYVPGPSTPAPDKVTYTDVTATATPITTQLANKGGAAATHFATGVWTQFGLAAVIGGYTLYNSVPIGSSGDALMLRLRTDLDGNLLQAATSFDQDPMRWLCVHISPLGMGNFLETGGNACAGFNPSATLAGPFVLQLNSIHKGSLGFVPATLPVSTCTNANPIVCTAPNHGLDQFNVTNHGTGRGRGPVCNIAGATGNWSAINGLKLCVPVGNTTGTVGSLNAFSIYDANTGAAIDGSSFGAWPGTGTFTVSPQIANLRIAAITATKPPTLTMTDYAFGADVCFGDGDPVGIDGFNATQFYWHKTDCSHGTIYLDQGFTQPVDNTSGAYNSANGMGIYFAETCPIGLPTSLTSGMLFDGIGAVGVRCFTVKGTGPCSWLAAPGEQAKYPCPSDPANTARSQLEDIAVGDSISDVRDVYFENMRLVQKTANGDGTFTYTFMRFFGHQLSAVNPGSGDNRSTGSSHQNIHQFGWQPFMVPTQTVNAGPTFGFMDATDPTNSWKMVDGRIGNHTEIGYGKAGLTTYTGGGGSDSVANVPLSFFNGYVLPNTWRFPVWNGLASPVEMQSYPNSRQKLAPEGEHVWVSDWQALNPSYGNGGGQGSGLYQRTLTGPLAGTQHVYKITGPSTENFNIKLTPMYGNAGPLLFRDISAPNSVIDDTKLGAMCIVLFANECVSGSAPGERYIAMTAPWDPGSSPTSPGYYTSNTITDRSPGVFQLGALMGYATQKRVDPFDISGKHWRALTRMFAAPGQHYSFQNWNPSPDAKWGFSVASPGGAGENWFMFKVPPWPKEDSIDRTTYVPVQVTANGDSVRVMFGYAENGDPTTSLYCTTRAEACYTTTGASQSSPFVFASEPQSYTSCAGGCTINVPGISGRALLYRIERKRGTLTTLGELQFRMVP